MNRGRLTIVSTVIVGMSALLLVSGCAAKAKAKPTSPCPAAQAQAAKYIAQAQVPASPPTLVPVPTGTSLYDVVGQAGARSQNYGADQAAAAAAATASEQAKLLAAYVEVQHPACFSDADIAQAQLWIDRARG